MADEPERSDPLHRPVTSRLFLPERWVDDAARRTQTHVPEDVTKKTKPELALDLIDQAVAWGVPFGLVLADSGYGDNPTLLMGLEERGRAYLCAVSSTFGVRQPDAVRVAAETVPPSQGRGRPRQPRPAPLFTVAALLATLPESVWQTITWRTREGEHWAKQFAAVRVHWGTGSAQLSTNDSRVHTGPEGWLLGERPLPGAGGDAKYYLSPLPADTPLSRLAALAHLRWPIEQFSEDGKGECGLGNYQGRR